MIALRLLLGKTNASACTYENNSPADANKHERERLSHLEDCPTPALSEAEYRLQKALDENTLQRLLIEQLQSQLAAQSAYIVAQLEQQPPANVIPAMHECIAQLEQRLALSEEQLAESVEAQAQAKAHITVLQEQRAQLVTELEQMEDGFHTEMSKVSVELKTWEHNLGAIDEAAMDTNSTHTRTASVTSSIAPSKIALSTSLERAKSATRIWALEDEVERVRSERDALRRRLGAGRANLMQLKRQASEVRLGSIGRASRGLKSESHLLEGGSLGRKEGRVGKSVMTRASDMQLNTRLVRPAMRGEPLTPQTSDDSASLRSR